MKKPIMGPERYSGAQALAELHEVHLRSFLVKWRKAKENQVGLPETQDRAYRSLETLLLHVLSCASRYISWTAEALELPPPDLPELPGEDGIEADAERLLDSILQAWRLPLADLPVKAFVAGEHQAWWGARWSQKWPSQSP